MTDLARIARHLLPAQRAVRRAFPPQALDAIERATAAAEAGHTGEIRFVVEGALPLDRVHAGVGGRERALELFASLRVWDTARNNGVLIYLLLADHAVEIVADRGIHALVGAEGWSRICRDMQGHFGAGRFEAGAVAGIAAVGALLTTFFPRARGEDDVNEVPDRPLVL
ncbi:MAG: TPM domain-containing protein [Burkholderiales bacterium]|jgi:uncharacterized membrane protein|nr:TPM domain-containing protein [Burkholderiales bacterium]